MITEEKINLNFVRWTNYLQKYNCYSEALIKDLGEQIKVAPYNTSEKMGGAYPGGLLDVVLNHLCKLAYNVNENGIGTSTPLLSVNTNLLIRVLLLQHISKSVMYTYQENEWKRKNGQPYDFTENFNTKLKLGEKSMFLCLKYGITLTEEEFEALLIIDKEQDKGSVFNSTLSIIVDFINKMTNKEILLKQNA